MDAHTEFVLKQREWLGWGSFWHGFYPMHLPDVIMKDAVYERFLEQIKLVWPGNSLHSRLEDSIIRDKRDIRRSLGEKLKCFLSPISNGSFHHSYLFFAVIDYQMCPNCSINVPNYRVPKTT